MKIVIIGTGNVAQVLGKMLLQANHIILQVFGRTQQTTVACAAVLGAEPVDSISKITTEAEICIIATSDNAIAAVAAQLNLPETIIVHTSGGISVNILNSHRYYGVLYPLQSLRKELPYLPKVPLFVDGCTKEVLQSIVDLAATISGDVHVANDEERLKLHVAAVFCSNFANHLFDLANRFCNSEGLSFHYLMPLMEETIHRMQFDAPANLQTGPAIRRDEITIQRHLQALQAYPLLTEVYKMLTQSIQNNEGAS